MRSSSDHAEFDDAVEIRICDFMTIRPKSVPLIEAACPIVRADHPELSRFLSDRRLQKSMTRARAVLLVEEIEGEEVEVAGGFDVLLRVGMLRRTRKSETDYPPLAFRDEDPSWSRAERKDLFPHALPILKGVTIEESPRDQTGVCLPPRRDVNRSDPVPILWGCRAYLERSGGHGSMLGRRAPRLRPGPAHARSPAGRVRSFRAVERAQRDEMPLIGSISVRYDPAIFAPPFRDLIRGSMSVAPSMM